MYVCPWRRDEVSDPRTGAAKQVFQPKPRLLWLVLQPKCFGESPFCFLRPALYVTTMPTQFLYVFWRSKHNSSHLHEQYLVTEQATQP